VLALVVTAALLGAFGLAALMEIGKLAGLTKGGIPSDNTRRYLNLFKVIHLVHGAEEPSRIIVTGPRIRSLTCQICMGAIKEGSNFTYCKCRFAWGPSRKGPISRTANAEGPFI